MKQETLEKVLESSMCQFSVIENKLAILYRNQVKIYDAVTKEQQGYSEKQMDDAYDKGFIDAKERSYSEEEVLELLNNLRLDSYNHGMGRIEFLEWFEQFKKK